MKRLLSSLLLSFVVAAPLSLTAQEKTTLRVGYLPVTGHAKFFIAQEEGFFAQEGLAIELVEFANSADGLAALRAGKPARLPGLGCFRPGAGRRLAFQRERGKPRV